MEKETSYPINFFIREKMKRIINTLLAFGLFINLTYSQVERIEPPIWWTGMVNPELQLMLYGDDLAQYSVSLEGDQVRLASSRSLESTNYLVLDLLIDEKAPAQTLKISLTKGRKKVNFEYELKDRNDDYITRRSFGPEDVLYLITPDRFVNGDPSNDEVDGMKEKPNRDFIGGRHGGDIKGIINSLDYIKNMGFTAIWVNPVLENDMDEYSYHGYAATDFYKIDARFGTNEEYIQLVEEAHKRGIKVIMDMIVNHCGSQHWWMNDLPASDWLNYQKEGLSGNYVITSHRKTTMQDPYVSDIDLKEFTDGWFVPVMPDLNQRNEVMAKYLIQNAIWWIEYTGIDGIRMDTYPYPDKTFMTDWTCQLQAEYPNFNTVGEEWYEDPAIVSYWQQDKPNTSGYTSCLPSLMDFPIQSKLVKALNDEESDWSGWMHLYAALGLDFQYSHPEELVVFPDNHDMSRFFTQVNENIDLFKLGMTYILTTRGTPQLYYGTEILMNNPASNDHGVIRSDFPGGWDGDQINAFTGEGLTDLQKDAREFIRTILNWRKDQTAAHYGKLLHYNPKNGIYVFFRYNESDKVMIVLSKNNEDVSLDLSRFSQIIDGTESGREVITGNEIKLNGKLNIPAMTPMIIDLD